MTETSTPAAPKDRFPPASKVDWLALVDKTLKGASVDSLVSRIEGVEIRPLYSRADAPDPAPLDRASRTAGERPFDLRAPVAAASPDAVRDALEGGAESVLIQVDGPVDALAAALDGVLTDVAPVALDAGASGLEAARALSDAVKASPSAPLALHLDPLGVLAAQRGADGSRSWAAEAAAMVSVHPKASLFLASGVTIHEAGGNPAWELGFAVASALAYARALEEAGLEPAAAFPRIALALAVDQKPLISIAKLRAARRLWSRVTVACNASSAGTMEARSSRRMLTLADPWSNLIRLTLAGLAGVAGAADAVVLYPHDASHPQGARLARNTGLVLMEESHMGRVEDPAAGGYAFEALTDQIARDAWTHMAAIEREGGVAAALSSGMIDDAVAASRAELQGDLTEKRLRIVGVTDHRPEGAALSSAPAPAGPLAPIRLESLVA